MVVIYHPDYEKHVQYHGHPESPERLIATIAKLKKEGFYKVLTPKTASDDEIGLVHAKVYIDKIRNFSEGYYDSDTYVRPETFGIAALAVGGALLASKYSLENQKPSFALLRPPGHHAGANYAGGFCYFNNAAIGAEWVARQKKKVAIVDIDVHHGNGTADIFYNRADVLYISTHLYGIYPGTGAATDIGTGDGKGHTVNIPFRNGCGDSSFIMAFDDVIEPIISQFKPEMLMVSLGGDSHYRDTLGSLTLSSPCYVELAKRLVKISSGKCAFMLEGGYDVDALAEITTAIVASFDDKKIKLEFTDVIDSDCAGKDIVNSVKDIQKHYWKI